MKRAEEEALEKLSEYKRVRAGSKIVGYYFMHEENGKTELADPVRFGAIQRPRNRDGNSEKMRRGSAKRYLFICIYEK